MKKSFIYFLFLLNVSHSISFQGREISADDIQTIDKDGKSIIVKMRLLKPTIINTPIGDFNCINYVYFYEDGSLRIVELSNPVSIKTEFGNLNVYQIEFYNSGKVFVFYTDRSRIKLEDEFDVSSISFYETGQVFEIEFVEKKFVFNGISFVANSLSFYKNGNIRKIGFEEPVSVETKLGRLKFLGFLEFYNDGKIRGGVLNETTKIGTGIGVFETTYVYFYRNGSIEIIGFNFPVDLKVLNRSVPVSAIIFYEDSKIKGIRLASDLEINGKKYFVDDYVVILNDNVIGKMELDGNGYTWKVIK